MNLDFQDGVSKLASQPIQVLRQLLGNPAHFKKYNSQYTLLTATVQRTTSQGAYEGELGAGLASEACYLCSLWG